MSGHTASQWNHYAEDHDPNTREDESPLSVENGTIANMIDSSNELLSQLVGEFSNLSTLVASSDLRLSSAANPSCTDGEVNELRKQVAELQDQLVKSEQRDHDLNSQSVERSVSIDDSSKPDGLSWEDRKAMIFQQMEDDSFDAEAFTANLAIELSDEACDPIAHVEQLHEELRQRDKKIEELKRSLQQHAGKRESQVATDEAVTRTIIDSEEILREERERLSQERERIQQLQAQWKERFREGEIAASLERAKLSRERRELSQRNEELEEQLAHFRQQADADRKAGVAGARRWLAKLGLDDKRS